MKIAKATLESITPYSQSRNIDPIEVPKLSKETPDAYEQRTWRHRMHVDADGCVVIPPTVFANAIKEAARRLQIQVPGRGKTLYTKYFEAGVMVTDGLTLPVKAVDVPCDRLHVSAKGIPGSKGGTRVYRNFPRIDKWSGVVTFFVFDDMITESVFKQVLGSAGNLVGIGRFRPENRGFYGRFRVASVEWIEDGDAVIQAAAE